MQDKYVNFLKMNFLKIVLPLFFICSCMENDTQTLNEEDFSKLRENVEWEYVDSLEVFKERFYEAGELIGMNIYDIDCVKIQKQTYNEIGNLDSLIVYYESGEIKEIRNYLIVSENKWQILNTWKHYSLNGRIDKENSFFYKVYNEKNVFNQFDTSFLDVTLVGPKLRKGEKIRAVVSNFNEYYDCDQDLAKFYDLDESIGHVKIPLRLDSLGKQNFRFILEKYEYEEDSIIEALQVFVNYEYIVNTRDKVLRHLH